MNSILDMFNLKHLWDIEASSLKLGEKWELEVKICTLAEYGKYYEEEQEDNRTLRDWYLRDRQRKQSQKGREKEQPESRVYSQHFEKF